MNDDTLKNLDLQLSLFLAEINPKKREQILQNQTFSVEDIVEKELVLKKQSDPFIRAFIDQLYRMLGNTAISWKDRDGTTRALSNVGVGGYAYLGTSNQAVAMDDYWVVTPIATGVGAGQMLYGINSSNYYGSSGIYTLGTSRVQINTTPFVNMSGGDITVEEVCFYGGQYVSSVWYYYTHARDLTGSIVVADGSALVVEYRLSVTV